MVYTPLTKRAILFAFDAHRGQYDKSGLPYITHPLHVAESMETEDECVVALLHDVLEDSECTIETIENIFGTWTADCVQRLSKIGNCNMIYYLDEIKRIDTTRLVKYADSLFNHSECVRNGDFKRAEKYQHNLNVLHSKELFKC